LYKPWRRRIDKKRVNNAHFEPLSQDLDTARPTDEEQRNALEPDLAHPKAMDMNVEPVEATDVAGPAHR
jgi:high-affinity nickel-transport protein